MSFFSRKKFILATTLAGLFFALQAQAAKIEFYVSNFGPDGIPVLAGEENSTDLTQVPENSDNPGTLVYSKHYEPHWAKTVHHTKTIVIYNPVSKEPICAVEGEIVIKEGLFGNVEVGGGAGGKIISNTGTTYGYCNQPQTDPSGDNVKIYVTAEAFTPAGTN